MSQYYWEADSADEGSLPSNATVTQPWSDYFSLQVAASTRHVDFPYGLKANDSTINSRRAVAFSAIDGNSLTESGVTEIYGVVNTSSNYNENGIAGRIAGAAGTETAVAVRHQGGPDELDFLEYDNGGFNYFQNAAAYTLSYPVAFRMQFDGSTVKVRIWNYDDTEPGTWDYTDTTAVSSGGAWGLHSFAWSFDGYTELLALGFGNSGDPAPTAPVSGAGISGTLSETLSGATSSASGLVGNTGSLSETLDNVTSNASGQIGLIGTLSETLANLTSAISGFVGTSGISGSGNITLEDLSQAANGNLVVSGSLAETLENISTAASGLLTVSGTINRNLANITCFGTGLAGLSGTINKTLGGVTAVGAGLIFEDLTGTADITLENVSIAAVAVAPLIYNTEPSEINQTIPHAFVDPDEQQKVIIENIIKLQQILKDIDNGF